MQAHIHGPDVSKRYALPPPEGVQMIPMQINGRDCLVPETASVLDACRTAGEFVPTICHHPRLKPLGKCEVCVVENAQSGAMVVSCSTRVEEGMSVVTDSQAVREKQARVIQKLEARRRTQTRFAQSLETREFDSLVQWSNVCREQANGGIRVNPALCIGCTRCVTACSDMQAMDILELSERGDVQGHRALRLRALPCIACGQCALFCPTGAIAECDHTGRALAAIASPRTTVVQTAPSVRASLGEEFGMAPGTVTTGKMVAALRRLGFDYVLDTNFGADLTIVEEAHELLERLTGFLAGDAAAVLPMFTSCCPGWVNFVEFEAPDLIPHLSSCKSPMGMQSALIRAYFAAKIGVADEDLTVCAVMPCIAKKQECVLDAQRDGTHRAATDCVLTTRELGAMLRRARIDFARLDEEEFDSPIGSGTGAAAIFGATGGVMEAALRTAFDKATGLEMDPIKFIGCGIRGLDGIREAKIAIPRADGEVEIRVAVCSGIKYARKLVNAIRSGHAPQYHFVEVMACPGGCIGGGGQPRSLSPRIIEDRYAAIMGIDERERIRKSHENPNIAVLYKEFLGRPGSHRAHKLLHVRHIDRSALVTVPGADVEEERAPEAPKGAEPLSIIFATQTNHSKDFAYRIRAETCEKDPEQAITVTPVEKVTPEWIVRQPRIVYITSTFGMGVPPDKAEAFCQWLEACPEGTFTATEFAVFGLGSTVYPLYCKAAIEADELFERKGARRFMPLTKSDQSDAEGHEAAMGPWLEKLWDVLCVGESALEGVPEPKYMCFCAIAMGAKHPPPPGYVNVRLVGKRRIVPEDAPREAVLLELDIAKTKLKYETGWHLGVLPRADNAVVERLCAHLGFNLDIALVCEPRGNAMPIPGVTGCALTIREILSQYLAITSRATKPFFRRMIPFASEEDAERLERLVSKECMDEFLAEITNECVTFAEAFELFPSVRPTFEYLLEWIPLTQPRLYSIASSHLLNPKKVELVVLIVDWMTPRGRPKTGVCTNFFRHLKPGSGRPISVFAKSSPLQPPQDPQVPITGIAMGSGVAPFRSFLQHRFALHEAGVALGPFTLYFGCRRRDEDAMCFDELLEYERIGVVKVITAFSREQAEKVYVTHRLEQNGAQIKADLGARDGFLGYCGPAGSAPANVEKIIKAHFDSLGLDGAARWKQLDARGLICIEAY